MNNTQLMQLVLLFVVAYLAYTSMQPKKEKYCAMCGR